MAGKFGKFLAFTAVTAAACAAVYYVLGNNRDDDFDLEDNGASDFFEKKPDREYVSINTDEIRETVDELKDKASESKDVIMGKLSEAAEQFKEKAAEVAEGVGLVKDSEKDTEVFEFSDLATEEDETTDEGNKE